MYDTIISLKDGKDIFFNICYYLVVECLVLV